MHYIPHPKNSYMRHRLDQFELVFHKASGMTHMLADPAPQLLDIVEKGAVTAEQALEKLQKKYDLFAEEANDNELSNEELNNHLKALISARLDELAQLGLVKAA